jgi:hypothetical protein
VSIRKTPENLEALRKEAEDITRALQASTDSTDSDVARVLELVKGAEKHLEEIRTGYYPTEEEQVHLDLAAALAALAKAGARAVALRLDRADPVERG